MTLLFPSFHISVTSVWPGSTVPAKRTLMFLKGPYLNILHHWISIALCVVLLTKRAGREGKGTKNSRLVESFACESKKAEAVEDRLGKASLCRECWVDV